MTPTERQELADRLRSLADGIEDGQTIQIRDCGEWKDQGETHFRNWLDNARNARVKPKPLEGWANTYVGNAYEGTIYATKNDAKLQAGTGAVRIAVHMREVIDD